MKKNYNRLCLPKPLLHLVRKSTEAVTTEHALVLMLLNALKKDVCKTLTSRPF